MHEQVLKSSSWTAHESKDHLATCEAEQENPIFPNGPGFSKSCQVSSIGSQIAPPACLQYHATELSESWHCLICSPWAVRMGVNKK